MKFADCDMADSMFVLVVEHTHENIIVNITHLLAWMKDQHLQLHHVPVDRSVANGWMSDNSIDPRIVNALTPDNLNDPIVFFEYVEPDGVISHILGDGRHRYVRYALEMIGVIKAYILKPEQWRPFAVEDVPYEMTLDEAKELPPLKLPRR